MAGSIPQTDNLGLYLGGPFATAPSGKAADWATDINFQKIDEKIGELQESVDNQPEPVSFPGVSANGNNGLTITGTPTEETDATTKKYVDNAVAAIPLFPGVTSLESGKLAISGSLTVGTTAPITIDNTGVAFPDGSKQVGVPTPSIVGAPTYPCQYGSQVYQVDAASGQHLWTCRLGGVAWENQATGVLSFVTRGCKYYVDSVNGDDTYSGKDSSKPYKTLTKLQTNTFKQHDVICLAANSVFKEQLTNNTINNVTVAAYGTGAMPLIDASSPISAEDWSKTGGQTNVYQATKTIATGMSPSNPDWYTSIWEDGNRFSIVHSIAAVDACSGSCYYPTSYNSSTGALTIYVHTSDGSNPGTNGKLYEYAARNYSIYFASSQNSSILGVRTRRAINANGSLNIGRGGLLIDVTAEEGTKHNLFMSAGVTAINTHTIGSYYENLGSSQWIGFDTAAPTLGWDFIGCTARTFGLTDTSTPGWYVHGASGNEVFDHITWKQSYGYMAAANIKNTTLDNSISTGNISIQNLTGYSGPFTVTVKNGSKVYFSASNQTGIDWDATNAGTITVSNSAIIGPGEAATGTTLIGVSTNSGVVVSVTDSFLYNPGNNHGIGFTFGSGASFTSLRNAINVGHYYLSAWDGHMPTLNSDYNHFFNYQSSTEFAKGATDYSVATYKTATGQDSQSTF